MKATILALAAGALASPTRSTPQPSVDIRDAHVTREGSQLLLGGQPWEAVGGNVYWLGLDENVTPPQGEPYDPSTKASYPNKGRITEAMAIIKAMGGTSIRAHTLGVSTGNPLSLVPSLGQVNQRAFDTIDWAVYQARQHGLRLQVPLTDNFTRWLLQTDSRPSPALVNSDYYHGGKYNFLRWHGFNLTQKTDASNPLVQQFYTNASIVSSFKEYIRTLVTHINPYTNLSYADDPTIWAYETGNELCGPVWGDMDVPVAWIRDISRFVKALAPRKLLVDGTYGVNSSHLSISEIDILSNHFYPVNISKLKEDLDLGKPRAAPQPREEDIRLASANKTYLAGEYGWTETSSGGQRDSLSSWFRVLEQSPVAAGSAFWSLFGHNVPNCTVFVDHQDGFTLQYG
ncbi:glycoside hydrolase [Thozetella sp. PMI_491]|nr:glycoside hydrolase [Thozetella sp. PMI_491]